MEEIEDPSTYYDINRLHKLKDKLSPEVSHHLIKYIGGLKRIGQEMNPKEFIQQSNVMLLEVSSNGKGTRKEYNECLKQLKQWSYTPQWQILQVKGLDS